jgi:ArsR family transcriptional regulator
MCRSLSFYKSLSEETRLKSLLLMKHQGQLCVCDLMNALQLSQPKVSRHLAELRKNELVIDERRGKWVYYQINPELESWMVQILDITLSHNAALIAQELTRIAHPFCQNE